MFLGAVHIGICSGGRRYWLAKYRRRVNHVGQAEDGDGQQEMLDFPTCCDSGEIAEEGQSRRILEKG